MFPKINEVLYIQIASADEKEEQKEYKSRIADADENSFLIEVPMQQSNSRLKKLFFGEELSISYINESGVRHYFNTYVTGFEEDVIRLVRIRKPLLEEISKIQRRSFLRVHASLELAVQGEDLTRAVMLTEDIGGGGLSIYCEPAFKIQEGQRLKCWLLVPYRNGGIDHVQFEAEVVRIKKLESGRELGMLKFSQIMDSERQKVIKFCFERQLDYRMK
ncbi:flagellar brake domain-containing protein [Paenibacillus barcinonensis]|uniref:C-di-GMP-binding flagellar brake protein YcgR n=1 Tax=Paenibacillus barcinonensis TaxID=198119 RepID=A0A2V4VE75_PAEBA|nr:flagellar brake domain-containing protein [Paenibacillus barcinonensis]PYE51364.1 c-di-GMP-binding flagellar brake protein YcgR [Paenibacillus barcinonensis]QKS55761.1 flagellar brake domain-containing protein [Paenibacillus barcinonensis]